MPRGCAGDRFYCFNCGANLHPGVPSTTIAAQTGLYIKSILLPPLGIFWAIPYLKQPDQKSKMIGIIATVITVALSIFLVVYTKHLMDQLTAEVNAQLGGLGY